jgi:two-component system cell cycle response regulator
MPNRGVLGAACGLLAACLGIAGALAGQRWLAGIAALFAAICTAVFLDAERSFRLVWRQREDLDARVAELEAELNQERDRRAELEAALPPETEPEPATAAADAPDDDADASEVLAEFAAAARAASLNDPTTGLFNEQFFHVTLDARISAARRHLRPVAVVLLDVAEGGRGNTTAEPVEPSIVASGLRSTLREADIACRLPSGMFALILEDTPENGAVWTVERVRRTLAATHPNFTLWAGVACYPAHAFDAAEILERAELALDAAREWRQDRIEVATSE